MKIIKYIFIFLFITTNLFADKVEWCVVQSQTGKILTCFKNKIQCELMIENKKNYDCVTK